MNKEKIKRKYGMVQKVPISIRINKRLSEWLGKNEYSPTAIFNEACKDLGYVE